MSQPVSAWQRFLEDLQLDEKGRAALREWGRSLLMNERGAAPGDSSKAIQKPVENA